MILREIISRTSIREGLTTFGRVAGNLAEQ